MARPGDAVDPPDHIIAQAQDVGEEFEQFGLVVDDAP
jgi:hypothetical protein